MSFAEFLERHLVFAYGTLRSPAVRRQAMGRQGTGEDATAPGYAKGSAGDYPVLRREPGEKTPGQVVRVSDGELAKLDGWEKRYNRRRLRLKDGRRAWYYRYGGGRGDGS